MAGIIEGVYFLRRRVQTSPTAMPQPATATTARPAWHRLRQVANQSISCPSFGTAETCEAAGANKGAGCALPALARPGLSRAGACRRQGRPR